MLKILDAAEEVILRLGMGHLTLDAVARRAGLSKAGLLHHFASKDALIDAMVARQTSEWHGAFLESYRALRDAGDRCPAVKAMMSNCLSGTDAWSEAERARNRVMVAALVHDERHVEPLRQVYRDIAGLLEKDDLPAGAGDTIHLAVHGLWFQWIFGMGEVSEARLREVRRAISLIAGFELVGPSAKGGIGGKSRSSTRGSK